MGALLVAVVVAVVLSAVVGLTVLFPVGDEDRTKIRE